MATSLPDEVRKALAAGEKLEAIRLLRKRTGLGLAEAKAAVESGLVPPAREGAGPVEWLSVDAHAALAAGNKIEAIRLVREERGIGLKEAKALVDAAQPLLPRTLAARVGEAPSGTSGRALLLVVAALLAALAWLLLGKG